MYPNHFDPIVYRLGREVFTLASWVQLPVGSPFGTLKQVPTMPLNVEASEENLYGYEISGLTSRTQGCDSSSQKMIGHAG